MKKMRIACGTLLLTALLAWGCPVWAAEPADWLKPAAATAAATDVVVQTEQSITAEVLVKQLVNRADEHFLLVVDQNGEEMRLDFMAEGETPALLVNAQTGVIAAWADVQPGSRVMVNYNRQPSGSQLHYLLLNLGNEPPAGLFIVEEMTGLLENRILVDNGRLWVALPKGVWQYPDDYAMLSLGVGHQVLLWYNEPDAGQQPAQATATKMLHVYSPQEIEQMRQEKIWLDMYYNDGQTRHLLLNGVQLPDAVRYVHGEPYLPLRQAAEALGYDVEWDAALKETRLSRGSWQARVVPYKGVFWLVGGQEQSYYGLPREYGNFIYVPAELFKIFGADIYVDGQTMIISYE